MGGVVRQCTWSILRHSLPDNLGGTSYRARNSICDFGIARDPAHHVRPYSRHGHYYRFGLGAPRLELGLAGLLHSGDSRVCGLHLVAELLEPAGNVEEQFRLEQARECTLPRQRAGKEKIFQA